MRRISVFKLVVLLPIAGAVLFAARRSYVVHRHAEATTILSRSIANGDRLPVARMVADFGESQARRHFTAAATSELLEFDGDSRIAQIRKAGYSYPEGTLDLLLLHDFADGCSTALQQPPIGTRINSVVFAGDGIVSIVLERHIHRNDQPEAEQMFALRIFTVALVTLCFASLACRPAYSMISIGTLTKETAAKKYGITMHAQKNGDAGIKVWIQFERKGWLERFTYAELRMRDDNGKHLLSAMLKPNPVHHRQRKDVTAVSFSVTPDQLRRCSFLVVCYNSSEGDAGYFLNAKDFLDLENPVTEEQKEP